MITQELATHRVTNDIRQSCWLIRRTYVCNGHKIRVSLRNDAYEFQSDYYVEVFNSHDLEWKRLHAASNNEWHSAVDALSLDRMKAEAWDACERLINHLVRVAQDLLEGIPA
jgi:hypothetical protein